MQPLLLALLSGLIGLLLGLSGLFALRGTSRRRIEAAEIGEPQLPHGAADVLSVMGPAYVVVDGVDGVVRALSSAMPMHWSTSAVSAAGNNGSLTAMWTGIGLSALLALIGAVGALRNRPATSNATASSVPATGRAADHAEYTDTAVIEADGEIEHAR